MRIATITLFERANADIQAAQADAAEAQRQVGSEKVADDLLGFGAEARPLVSARGFLARAQSYERSTVEVANRLGVQDLALGQAATAAQDLRLALTDALAAGRGDDLSQALDLAFSSLRGALNTTYAGRYVFSGVAEDTAPVDVASVAALPAVPAIDTIFNNAQRTAQAQIDPTTTVELAPLADTLATDFFAAIKQIDDFNTATPLAGPLDAADRTFLEARIADLLAVFDTLNNAQAANGATQARVADAQERLSDEAFFFENLAGDIENADLAEVAGQLNQANVRIEASAVAFNALRESSLLNFL